MFSNYFTIGWRNFTRNRSFTIINVIGLASGLACCIVIYTMISYHLSFDNFHRNSDRIYRMVLQWHDEGIGYSAAVPSPLGKAFREDFTFAEKTARMIDYNDALILVKNGRDIQKFEEPLGVAFTEPAYFDIFNFPLLSGNRKTMLTEPNTAIITQRLAKKYFGNDEPIGKTLRFNNKTDFRITGVLQDIPKNAEMRQEIYLSYSNLVDHNSWLASETAWAGVYSGSKCYTLLKPSVTATQVNQALKQTSRKYYTGRDQKVWQFRLQPLSDVHFNPDYDGFPPKYLWALFYIGAFLLVTACVNFINLATALALKRSREVGIRKVLGSQRSQIFWQFIAETAIITLFATAIAVGLAAVALPWVNGLFHIELSLNLLHNAPLAGFIVLAAVTVIFLAGSYPGLVLARFLPVLALKSTLTQRHIGGFSLRRVLVIAQFSISQMMIIGTLVIAGQVRYTRSADLGFNKDGVVLLHIPSRDPIKSNTLRDQLNQLTGVKGSSLCFQAPASGSNNTTGVRYDNRPEEEHWSVNNKTADANYLETFGVKLIAGRNFFPADSARELLVNETFVKNLHVKSVSDVIGKTVSMDRGTVNATIVGVVKDFYNHSFRSEVSAVTILPESTNYQTLALKVDLGQMERLRPQFERLFNATYPEYVYNITFLDDQIARFYEMDTIMLKLTQLFSGIAILIGGLGLYGLVSFMALRKTKEIGLRKVLGATIRDILWIFGKEFSRLLLIAFAIAAPLAWWAMRLYLQEFQYRIGMGPGIFLLAIGGTFFIALLTIGYRSARAATANPVTSLRTE